MIRAMVNAAKSDGRIDQTEGQRILGQLEEAGANQEVRDYLMAEVKKPMDLRGIVSAAGNRPELGAQLRSEDGVGAAADRIASFVGV